ncbi:hypothetical protein Glove_319g29 [Diversispora epigaea]|uniref:Uncharacterized protein n=1 Tax=Diversispora epigaea TaxID=1348612 RepID=A0A397HU51_9GLOM|nr:hypothetical protein Glove_319g29 [Diversispora epigaea]
MFYDLNIPFPTQPNQVVQRNELRKRIEILIKLGYQVIAFNHIVTGKINPNKTNPIKTLDYEIFDPNQNSRIEQLTRITIILEDSNQNIGLKSSNATASYDIISVQPTNEKLFQNACGTFEADIISLEMGSRLPFYIKHSTVGLAIERGVFFEICYAPAIRDASSRRQLISNAQNLVRVTRGKNIIITSEAQRAMELRGPYDIMNLATIMGMNQATAKECISTNCRSVVMHAATRRNTHKAAASFEPITSLKLNDLWKIGKEKSSNNSNDNNLKRMKFSEEEEGDDDNDDDNNNNNNNVKKKKKSNKLRKLET